MFNSGRIEFLLYMNNPFLIHLLLNENETEFHSFFEYVAIGNSGFPVLLGLVAS